jgi:hypothetical protein
VQEDLVRLLDHWSPVKTRLETIRERLDAGAMEKSIRGKESSGHLARLWANEEVNRLVRDHRRDSAVQLAGKHQLVTLVSGAVVLETKQQFDQAGLQPVNPETVPAVPEPGAMILLLVAVGVMCLMRFRRWIVSRRAAAAAS